MEIVVTGRHGEVPERFRRHVADKLAKLERHNHRIMRLEVVVSKERNPRLTDQSDRVELTVHSKGPIIRAEAAAQDRYAALDLALERLQSRLRKAADRRRIHRGARTPVSVAEATNALPSSGVGVLEDLEEVERDYAEVPDTGPVAVEGEGPLVVREKIHEAVPMSLDQALYEMELVGHDFYLFVDSESKMPSVVYRRKGYDYGVIRLSV